MIQIIDAVRIYKFYDLCRLKNNFNYDNYLVVCIGNSSGVWYQLINEVLIPNHTGYFKEKLGLNDPEDQIKLLDLYNTAVQEKSYETLKATKIKHNQFTSWATTDRGIILNTKRYKNLGGMYWHREGNI